jgi:hypothetical protein
MNRAGNDYRTPDGRWLDTESVAVMAEPLRLPSVPDEHDPTEGDGRCRCACCELQRPARIAPVSHQSHTAGTGNPSLG